MQGKPCVLYICSHNGQPAPVEATLARGDFEVLLAKTVEQAIAQLARAEVVVISSCWPREEKHNLLDALAQASASSKIPIVCMNDDPHRCGKCTEADPLQPENLVSIIRRLVGSGRPVSAALQSDSSNCYRWWVMRKGTDYALACITESSIPDRRLEGWQVWEPSFDSCEEAVAAIKQWRERSRAQS